MARRSQCSSAGDNPLDSNYLPPHYREDYRLAIDALIEEDLEGYYKFLQKADVVDFLSTTEIDYIQSSVQVPLQSQQPEQHFLEPGDDGSSDTYWPIHSDLDVPGLDLGWPQMHHFIGPTEVTTLVSPPEPDMPSIKEQARRLVKNAQQVIAVVMDMFTDIDMFSDILNAAMRNVAVYIILDEQNAHHFVNMAMNCRVNLQSIQFLRVRTVSGITYHCRSGKSFKGQMMNRFLLTDCRAVLSGNYSFMWSFEKIHRSMAHLFLGQLVSTFDEEFRILFAQSQPLVLDNMLGPMEEFGLAQKRPYPSERAPLFRDTRRFLSVDTGHLEERTHRHSFDDRMDLDWRMMPLKRPEGPQGPPDFYGRFPLQQPRKDLPFELGPSRVTMLDNPAFKRHSYAEGGRFSYPFLPPQGVSEPENQARQFHRGQQQPYQGPLPGPEADYGSYDKFWNQDFHSADQYSEPGIPAEIQPPDNFDPVLNYLSSSRKMDFDQSLEKVQPPAGSPHTRRHSQPYACQTSPTPSNSADQKQLLQEPSTHRKDPSVKRGLRNWRISSFLSAYDNSGDEGLPMAGQASDPFEEPLNPIQPTAPGVDLTFPKIPNVREFKVPAIPRASQMPGYIKTLAQEQPKKVPPEPPEMALETSSTPSESSSSVEVERAEDVELKEPKTIGLRREESFRRKFNPTVQRGSRLRSSLIFSSLEQNAPPDSAKAEGQQDEESERSETEPTKLPFISQVLGQRRPPREPYEWSRYIRPNTVDIVDASKRDDGSSKAEDENLSKDSSDPSVKAPAAQQSPSVSQSKPEPPNPEPPAPALISLPAAQSFVDMSDPDARFMFFKELAAKRKAEKAAEAEKSKEQAQKKKPAPLKEEAGPKDAAGSISSTSESSSKTNVGVSDAVKAAQTESRESDHLSSVVSGSTDKEEYPKEAKLPNTAPRGDLSQKNAAADRVGTTMQKEAHDPPVSLSPSEKTNKPGKIAEKDPKEGKIRVSADSEKKDLKPSQPATALPISAEAESSLMDLSKPSEPPGTKNKQRDPLASADAPSPAQVTDKISSCDSTSEASSSLTPSSVEVPPSSASPASGSDQSETKNSKSAPLSDQPTGSVQSSGGDVTSGDSSSTPKPSTAPQNSHLQKTAAVQSETKVAEAEPVPEKSTGSESSSSKPAVQSSSSDHCLSESGGSALTKVDSSSIPKASQTVQETSTQSETARACPEPVSQLSSSESPAAADSDTSPNSSSSQSTTQIKSCASAPSGEDSVQTDHTSAPEKTQVLTSADDNKLQSSPPTPKASSPKSALPSVSLAVSVTSSPDHSDQTSASTSAQDSPKQPTPPSVLGSVGSLTPAAAESPSAPPTESVGAVLLPEADKPENMSLCDRTDSRPEQVTTGSNPSTETSTPTEPTSNSPAESDSAEPAEKVENVEKTEDPDPAGVADKGTTPESLKNEKTNEQAKQNNCSEAAETASNEALPPSPQSKQPKSSQSRYLSSTANVLASSNLRDDTKLLLEQISANSQSRSEVAKEAPVTDDEKEDEADKNAKREKERGFRTLGREPAKSTQEREKLLERIQSMRKERRVYSRFEMAP